MAIDLDDVEAVREADTRGVLETLALFDRQLQAGSGLAAQVRAEDFEGLRNAVFCALGGSAIAGDLVPAALAEDLSLPWAVHRNYGLPAFADANTLVVVSSYSGDTEETLDAFEHALERECRILCVTSGGRVAEEANARDLPWIGLPSGLAPRNALGYAFSSILAALGRIGLAPAQEASLKAASESASRRSGQLAPRVPEKDNPAKKLARRLHGRIVHVYGSSGFLYAAARRWSGQIAENAKQMAQAAAIPEMNHNEVAGWKNPKEPLKKAAAVFLRDQRDHPRIAKRFQATREVLAESAGDVMECWSEGESRLQGLVSLLQLIDYASVYLAFLNNADPNEIETIDYLKKRLAQE